jgi:hypothetical protein
MIQFRSPSLCGLYGLYVEPGGPTKERKTVIETLAP